MVFLMSLTPMRAQLSVHSFTKLGEIFALVVEVTVAQALGATYSWRLTPGKKTIVPMTFMHLTPSNMIGAATTRELRLLWRLSRDRGGGVR